MTTGAIGRCMRAALVVILVLTTARAGMATRRAYPWTSYHFVAHALGVPDGSDLTYCNCREGFRASYAHGFRNLEADVMMMADGVPVAYHGGFAERLGISEEEDKDIRSLTSKQFDALTYEGFDTLTGPDLLDILRRHPDAHLLLHTKRDHTITPEWFLRNAEPSVRSRLVFYVIEDAQVKALRGLGAQSFIIPIHDNLAMTPAKAAALAKKQGLHIALGSAEIFTPEAMDVLERGGIQQIFADRGYRKIAVNDDEEKRIVLGRMAKGLKVYSDRWWDGDATAR